MVTCTRACACSRHARARQPVAMLPWQWEVRVLCHCVRAFVGASRGPRFVCRPPHARFDPAPFLFTPPPSPLPTHSHAGPFTTLRAQFVDALEEIDAQLPVEVHLWLDRRTAGIVNLSQRADAFIAKARRAALAPPGATVYWFTRDNDMLASRRKVDAQSYAEFKQYAESRHDPAVWVWTPPAPAMGGGSPEHEPGWQLSMTVQDPTAVPSPAAPVAAASHVSSRSSRSSAAQGRFRDSVIERGGGELRCTLCGATAGMPQEYQAAHVIAHSSPADVRLEADLLDINSPRNGILLCATPCHLWYDKLHWWVDADGNVAATDALLSDEVLGAHFTKAAGKPLGQPPAGVFEIDRPTARMWAVQARLCREETARRQSVAATAAYKCGKCGKGYQTPGGFQHHAGSCKALARSQLFTPAARSRRGGVAAAGVW